MTVNRLSVYCGLGIVLLSVGAMVWALSKPPPVPPLVVAAAIPTSTPEPTSTPAPPPRPTFTPLPESTPVTYTFQGTASTTSGPMQLHKGPMIMGMAHRGRGNFVIHLLNSEGKIAEYALANAIGTYDGQKVFAISRDDVYFFDVLADGPWFIMAKQLN